MVGTCETCTANANCAEDEQCVLTGGGRVCLPRCTIDDPTCPDGFTCSGVETTFCAPEDGRCCIDADDDGFGQGVQCLGPDCNDDDETINPDQADVCNGVDDDCDTTTADGLDDPDLGAGCDGGDSDLCEEGVNLCVAGELVCDDMTPDDVDLCDGVDNDCDASTADGSGEPLVGTACDSDADPDLCMDDFYVCDAVTMTVVCLDSVESTPDLCDGVDNDCDPSTPDGSGDPAVGVACDGADGDLCNEGTTVCEGGALVCTDDTGDIADVCDGVDNDCDPSTVDGADDAAVGTACDGADSDLCAEGTQVCSVGVLTCTDTSGDDLDVCDGVDNDCDPASADGSEDAAIGVACDGADADLCNEGVTVCTAGAVACTDTSDDTRDVCDGEDNDCNPVTPDGFGDELLGVACDGDDTDLCLEGEMVCEGGVLSCDDATGDLLDVCDGEDNDCDPLSADGAEDAQTGTACDGADSDLCNEGARECVDGAFACTDDTDDLLDICDGEDNDCNPITPDGFADPALGDPCDGADSDLCNEGELICSGGALACNDATGDLLDVCDGEDNDCDPSSADGDEDPGLGVACDGADTDLCQEGETVCSAGALVCDDDSGDTADVCDGVDNDCNPGTPDGAADPALGDPCDGPDSDLCDEGALQCSGGALVCSDATGDLLDVCDGVDNDCDPSSADGDEDPGIGVACDGGDADECEEGTTVCGSAGVLVCSDDTGDLPDVCDGIDNDCDPTTPDGAADPSLGDPCDGPDSDLCIEGTRVCTAGTLTCNDASGDDLDMCDGVDNDCNPATPDGDDDPAIGVACDGGDADLCNEGTVLCAAGTQVCSDATAGNPELCNGIDDDCNPATPDGASEPWLGVACDGTDGDLCTEGTFACVGGDQTCGDTTGTINETCNGVDDDCDVDIDEGFDLGSDELNCGSCGNTCTNAHGDNFCSGGACNPVCDPLFGDCDGDPDDGCETPTNTLDNCGTCGGTCALPNAGETCAAGSCEITTCDNGFCDQDGADGNGCEHDLDTNPGCGSVTVLGNVSGDTGSDSVSFTGHDERWFRFHVNENESDLLDCDDLGARITLTPGAGTNYNLDAYCDGCTTLAAQSNSGGSSPDQVHVRWDEKCNCVFGICAPTGSDSGRDIYVRVRFASGNKCTNYNLLVEGNKFSGGNTCGDK